MELIMSAGDPHKDTPVLFSGEDSAKAKAAVIMMHGRGSGAEEILSLAEEFPDEGFVFAAPQAENNTWYPYSFLYPIEQNEPGITSGLKKIESVILELTKKEIPNEKIMLLGFSQGACLALEFSARHPARYGGIIGLSGGLIGQKIIDEKYTGNLDHTPVFLGCSDVDPHIPLERVSHSAEIFIKLNGNVEKRIYKNMHHTINKDEISYITELMNSLLT
jgi:phospholipase/carboxylesterase